jgi:oligopeptide transport system substrate-binding protein
MKNLILLMGVLLLIFGCSKQNNFDEREINLITPEKIFGFDPIQSSDKYSSNEIGKVYEGLYEFHPLKRPYELMPNLAESLPTVSEDGLTYTFKMKKGVLFHDSPAFKDGIGREVKSDDFIFSMKRLSDPKLNAKGWWLLDQRIVGLNEWRTKYAGAEPTNNAEEILWIKK